MSRSESDNGPHEELLQQIKQMPRKKAQKLLKQLDSKVKSGEAMSDEQWELYDLLERYFT